MLLQRHICIYTSTVYLSNSNQLLPIRGQMDYILGGSFNVVLSYKAIQWVSTSCSSLLYHLIASNFFTRPSPFHLLSPYLLPYTFYLLYPLLRRTSFDCCIASDLKRCSFLCIMIEIQQEMSIHQKIDNKELEISNYIYTYKVIYIYIWISSIHLHMQVYKKFLTVLGSAAMAVAAERILSLAWRNASWSFIVERIYATIRLKGHNDYWRACLESMQVKELKKSQADNISFYTLPPPPTHKHTSSNSKRERCNDEIVFATSPSASRSLVWVPHDILGMIMLRRLSAHW